MKNYTILLALMLGFTAIAEARPRTEAQQMQAAAQAINAQCAALHKAPRKGQLRQMARHGYLNVMGYDAGGFAIVTTDDLLPAVVAYSDKTYEAEAPADGFRWWLEAMTEAAAYYVQSGLQARVSRPNTAKVLPFVRPLLSTEWGQEEPFYNACPMLPDEELYPRHCVVGCVATATAQILNYHQWPTTGQGTTSLQVPSGDPLGTSYFFDFSKCRFDWPNMRNTYTVGNYTDAEAKAVADLSHAMGMMAQMQYGVGTSGAISDDAADGLRNYFGIETATYYARGDLFGFGDNYTEQEWCDMVFEELSSVGPVYYAGADADDQGGHAFVLDGYDADGLVHVNWGWYGRFDGYYDVSILNPRIYHFSKQQEMIRGICPPNRVKGMTQIFSLDEAGTLASEIEAFQTVSGGVLNISTVRVHGPMNADDVHTLADMKSLEHIDLSDATLEGDLLPPYAFYSCSNLRSLSLPRGLRFYGDAALAGCSNLNQIDLPEGDGQGYAMLGGVLYTPDMKEVIAVLPTAPDTVSIAEGVTRLHDHAFEGCKYVRIVTLPRSLDVVGERALADVLIMRELHVNGSLPAELGAEAFAGVDPGFLKLFIPAGSRQAYEQAEGWHRLFRSDNVVEAGTMIRARNITRAYGEDLEEYYYEIIGQRVKGLPLLTCEATKVSPAGQYDIIVSKGTVESADPVELVNGTLTVVGGPVGISDANEALSDDDETFLLGYAGGEVATKSSWGGIGNDNTSAAIYIPASTLASMGGAQIKAVRAGLATRLNIDELSVWVRSSLTGDNLAEGKLNRKQTRVQQGWNEVALVSAYTIPQGAEGVYIGYTYHHTSVSNAVSVVGSTPEQTAFVKKSESDAWTDISSEGAISIEAVVSGSQLVQYDLALQRAALAPSLSDGLSAYKVTLEVANMGTRDVSGFDVTMSSEAIAAQTVHVAQPVASGRFAVVSFVFKTSAPIDYAAEVQAAITALDDGSDAQPDNNAALAACRLERNVLLEEFTTESCPNCPDGAETMQTALQSQPVFADRINVVCHHSGFNTDWLTQSCDKDYLWFFNEGGSTYAPAWMIDRKAYFESNYVSGNQQAIYWPHSDKEFAEMLDGALSEEPHAQIGATATLGDGIVTVSVIGLYDDKFSTANSLLTVYLTEDNIAAHEQQGRSGVVSGFTHHHVIRAYNSTWGEQPDFSQDMTIGYTTSLACDPAWKVEDLKVVAVLARYDASSNLNCAVENSVAVPVRTGGTDAIGVRTVEPTTAAPTSYTLGGLKVDRCHRGLIVTRQTDGTVVKTIRTSRR